MFFGELCRSSGSMIVVDRAVVMFESCRDFQGVWEGWKAGLTAFHAFHTPAFHGLFSSLGFGFRTTSRNAIQKLVIPVFAEAVVRQLPKRPDSRDLEPRSKLESAGGMPDRRARRFRSELNFCKRYNWFWLLACWTAYRLRKALKQSGCLFESVSDSMARIKTATP
jgi:hypothetical protein